MLAHTTWHVHVNRGHRVSAFTSKRDADLTALLQAWSHGDAEALERLAPLVQ